MDELESKYEQLASVVFGQPSSASSFTHHSFLEDIIHSVFKSDSEDIRPTLLVTIKLHCPVYSQRATREPQLANPSQEIENEEFIIQQS
ncbi:hypothetical protein H5410_057632 [Solanum commersonii]|uniref:Uncharacterized protein n=1 Tax=Solanum commersonii TaxID=4109 RepID=A0A9J5WPJ2_SOLCO|nr:hypothetical protein H5410_057632 [Solanum commersonii]